MTLISTLTAEVPRLLDTEDRIRVTTEAIEAAIAVARKHGIRVGEPQVLGDSYSLRIHLAPSPVVARVSLFTPLLRSPIEDWLAREISITSYLAASGVPVVPPSDDLPPGPHHHDGYVMSFWRYAHPVAAPYVPEADIAAGLLAELHSALRRYSGDLPFLAPPLNDIPRGLDRIERGNLLPASDIALLRAKFAELVPKLNVSPDKWQPLHGDAHAHNLIPTNKGLVWNDFEDVCRGPIGWDLASMNDSENRLLAAYPNAPSLDALEPFRQTRQIHAVTWVYSMKPEFPDWEPGAKAILDQLRES